MKKETIKKRLEQSDIKKNSLVYKMISELINEDEKNRYRFYNPLNKVIRPNFYSGVKRFAKVQKHEYELSIALNVLKIKYNKGNDAPRGGLCGVYFEILTNIE